jgi:hypothetical protein
MHNWSAYSLGNAGDSQRFVLGVGALRGIFFVLLLLVTVAVEAQTLTKEGYAKDVTKVSKQICPLELQGCVVDSFFYQPNYLHEVLTMKDDYMFDRSNEELKQYFADVFRYRFEIHACKGLYEKLLKMDGGFVIDMTLDSSHRSFSIAYTPEEFKQIWADRKKPEYQDSLTWMARHDVFMSLWFQNKYDCSKTVTEDNPLSIDSVWLSGDTVVFHTTVLDTAYSYVEEDRDNLILFWKETLLFTEGNYLADDMADAGYHFLSAYENVSRTDSFHVFFSNSTLQDFLLQVSKISEATDEQMEAFIWMTSNDFDVKYLGEPKDLKLGDRVRITSGPLKGQTGNVKRIKKDRKFVITIGNVAAFTIEGITHDMMEKIDDVNIK